MPLYEYRCEKCQIVFAELRKLSEREDPIECPQCGGAASIIFSSFAQTSGTSGASGSCPTAGGCGQRFT
jgi:putative FmdB family regulatory protein